MPEIGLPGTATYATTLSGIEEMLTELPDNTGNEISAQKMRNVVYTLYDEIQSVTGTEFFYTNPNPITNPVGNWTTGKTFSNVSLEDLFKGIFYKDSGPVAELSASPAIVTQEFKQPGSAAYNAKLTAAGISTSLSNSGYDELVRFKLLWEAKKGTYNLQNSGAITRDPASVAGEDTPLFTVPISPNGSNNETIIIRPRINVTNTYSFTFKDINGTPAPAAKVSVVYGIPQYIGTILAYRLPTDAEIIALGNSGVSGTGGFKSLKGDVSNHGGGNTHLIIVTTETLSFEVFGNPWKEYVNLGTVTHTNIYGYPIQYKVYVTPTKYNSGVSYKIK